MTLGGHKVTELVTLDGYKFVMDDGGWLLVRFSGTEPLLRVYSRIQWIRPNGTVRGTLKHWYEYSRWTSDQLQGTIESGPCANILDN